MYKVLIVDDFEADRLKLKRIVDSWGDDELIILGECETGMQALDFIEQDRPDIIISDIEMPYMNGIEMAKRIKAKYKNEIKIIFCTLYNEFRYAKEAIYSNSYGYILKPIQSNELYECIKRVIGDVSQEIQFKEEYNNVRSTLESFKPILIDSFLKEILYGINTLEADISEKIDYFNINLKLGFFQVLYIEIDDFDIITLNQKTEEKQLFSLKIFEKIHEIANMFGGYPITRIDEMHFVMIVSKSEMNLTKTCSYECAEKIRAFIRTMNISISISMSDVDKSLVGIKNLFEQCKFIMKYKFIIGKGKIISSEDIPTDTGMNNIDINALQKDIKYLLNAGNREEITQYIDNQINDISQKADDITLRNYCFLVVIALRFTMNENNINLSEIFSDESLIWEKLQKFETILDAANWIKNLLFFAFEHLSKKSSSKNSTIMLEIKKYVLTNINNNFGLEDIASALHYSANYLNCIFKQECGETINDFITGMKINKAKEMLADIRNKVQDISDALGFSHAAYFCSVFKRITGVTPKEYRERR